MPIVFAILGQPSYWQFQLFNPYIYFHTILFNLFKIFCFKKFLFCKYKRFKFSMSYFKPFFEFCFDRYTNIFNYLMSNKVLNKRAFTCGLHSWNSYGCLIWRASSFVLISNSGNFNFKKNLITTVYHFFKFLNI